MKAHNGNGWYCDICGGYFKQDFGKLTDDVKICEECVASHHKNCPALDGKPVCTCGNQRNG